MQFLSQFFKISQKKNVFSLAFNFYNKKLKIKINKINTLINTGQKSQWFLLIWNVNQSNNKGQKFTMAIRKFGQNAFQETNFIYNWVFTK